MESDRVAANKKKMKSIFLFINVALLAGGQCAGPLIMRLYFLKGGNRIWLSSTLTTVGCPLNLIPLIVIFFLRRRKADADHAESRARVRAVLMDRYVFLASALVGVLTGADNYMYAYGVSKLPVTTGALIIASQLAFTALFAFLLVGQKLTSFTINAVFLLTVGAAVLALRSSSDRPKGETNKEYYIGFIIMVVSAVIFGGILPLIEWIYKKARQAVTYTLVLEVQFVLCFFATVVTVIGMIINNDFKVIPREAREFELGETKYYVILICSAIIWQCFFLGAVGVICLASSLFSGIVIAVLLPVTEVLAVIFYKEKFQAEKGVSLVLCLWGFFSYFYGEIKHNKEVKKEVQDPETELLPTTTTHP